MHYLFGTCKIFILNAEANTLKIKEVYISKFHYGYDPSGDPCGSFMNFMKWGVLQYYQIIIIVACDNFFQLFHVLFKIT